MRVVAVVGEDKGATAGRLLNSTARIHSYWGASVVNAIRG